MPTTITVECDGYRFCGNYVETELGLNGLAEEQIEDIKDDNHADFTKEQIERNAQFWEGYLVEEDYKDLEPGMTVRLPVPIDRTCAPCGSDQDYDEEGNNITAE